MKYKSILSQAIDLHIHVGPEIIPRKFDLTQLLKLEKGKLRGVGVKNHFFTTSSMPRPTKNKNLPIVIDSIVLNNYVGRFNVDAIYACSQLSTRPIIVWFPTLNSKKFLEGEKFEIPSRWIGGNETFANRKANEIKSFSVLDENGKISDEVKNVLLAIKNTGAILATGHISWQESRKLVSCATKMFAIRKIIITHPIYQKINMPIHVQKELADMGALIEQCYSMYSIDKIPISKIARQIKLLGAKNCILSSDVGQIFSKNPSEALADFMFLLEKEGITKQELRQMLVNNPIRLLNK